MSTNYINQIKDSNNTTQYLADGTDTRIFTGTCSTPSNQAVKEVVLNDPTNFSYSAGTKILVNFTYGNTRDDDYITIEIQNVSPVKNLDIFIGGANDLNADSYYWGDNESVLFTYAPADSLYDERWSMTGCSGIINYLIQKSLKDTCVRQGFIAPGTSGGNAYPLLLCGESGISSTSSRGSISANLNNGLRYTPYGDSLITENLSTTNNIPSLFKVTTVSKSVGVVNAHSYVSASNLTIPSASIPSGYKLVAIVGWQTSDAKVVAHTKRIVNDSTIFCGFSNTTASNSGSCTYTFYLLWAKVSTISFPVPA